MENPYLCPACGTNRSRFNLIQQKVRPVKKDPQTGKIVAEVDASDPLQAPYRGEELRVQCGVCGVVDAEQRFVKTARRGTGELSI
ncbi:DNA alkylation repair protein [Kroppenstedtia eburnea]|uniref:Uncharacterized protein n=1 Tax=Kroppenstedtia eburnea TaxID=714067 RepID=A0A1N7M0L3_9BACL|nr:hypothetical protein [Kroppenstedtia eburnea]QKI81759.1 DNA alkylation repair protein [Kroppenstedtia eburnea]SIS79607.1 hypothetical protein SAMN05421790_105119 [Kroppenstedtia eburnea]